MATKILRKLGSWRTAVLMAVAAAPLALVGCVPIRNPFEEVALSLEELAGELIAVGGL